MQIFSNVTLNYLEDSIDLNFKIQYGFTAITYINIKLFRSSRAYFRLYAALINKIDV